MVVRELVYGTNAELTVKHAKSCIDEQLLERGGSWCSRTRHVWKNNEPTNTDSLSNGNLIATALAAHKVCFIWTGISNK